MSKGNIRNRNNRRRFLEILSGIGLGAAASILYERLYDIPSLQEKFRKEVSYWMNQYYIASEELKKNVIKVSQLEGEVNSLNKVVSYQDKLENEATSAISDYKQRMEEAVNKLKNTIEKYRIILGDERVSFESASLKVLEDLKLTENKLEKVLAYFPLIKNLSFSPSKVINGKVYDLNVRLEVISPINTLKKVEIKLIPVEYDYFITDYGVRKEDYPLVFPQEETRIIKLNPKGLEKEIFEANFTNLRGGREYIIKANIEDTDGKFRSEEIKTPYIREFENIAPLKDILITAYYYPWYSPYRHWQEGYKGTPLLGKYNSQDPIVISKHIDYATGHGIGAFIISWWGPNSFEDVTIRDYFLKNPLINDIKIQILYESTGRLKVIKENNNSISIDLDDPTNRQVLLTDFNYLANTYFDSPHYLKIGNSPKVELHLARIFKGDVPGIINSLREQVHNSGHDLYLIGDLVYWQNPVTPSEKERIKLYDAVTAYNMHTNVQEILNDFENKVAKKYNEWFNVTKDLKVGFIPSALPGFDDSAVRAGNIPLPKSTDRFKKQIEIAKSYIDNNLKTITITTFNEWHEYTYIEPSIEYTYEYLQIIKEYIPFRFS